MKSTRPQTHRSAWDLQLITGYKSLTDREHAEKEVKSPTADFVSCSNIEISSYPRAFA